MSDREAGLKYLKPSKKDLEHGLELHRNSLVMETYGFMPRAAPDGDAFASKMKENASPIELQDLQEEMITTRFADNSREREEFVNAWEDFWPAGSYPHSANPEAVKSMAWTNWPLFTVGMVQMGYSDENILGGNAIRVAKAA